METSAALSSLHQTVGSVANSRSVLENSSKVHLHCGSWSVSGNRCVPLSNFNKNRKFALVLNANVSKSSTPTKTDSSDARSKEKKTPRRTTFPNELEALVHEVCDETAVAELKVKVGDFEMHLKRKIGEVTAPAPFLDISPTVAPPIPSEPMNKSAPAGPSPPKPKPKPSSERASPFINTSFGKSSKLASLDASGSDNYVLVSSPSVGTFRREAKGKKQARSCKEGEVIKEGQVIGYLHQLGTELPLKSDVAGEVLKLLCNDGDSVGYGDPLAAILPSFHDINIQ